ncbi:hypothetical protein PMAYCL1PPCAC_22743, partial [Pristionchus mayeri]
MGREAPSLANATAFTSIGYNTAPIGIDEESFTYDDIDEDQAIERIALIFSRCSRIEKIELSLEQFKDDVSRKALVPLNIDQFTLVGRPYCDPNLQNMIVGFLQTEGQVRRIVFRSWITATDGSLAFIINCGPFFTEVVKVVAEAEISAVGVTSLNTWDVVRDKMNGSGEISARLEVEENEDGRVIHRL